jgi:hypothetical protein
VILGGRRASDPGSRKGRSTRRSSSTSTAARPLQCQASRRSRGPNGWPRFGAWREKVGAALVDVGSPFGSSASVRDDGTEGTAADLIGYTIIEAHDLAAAKAFTDGLPFLSNSDGNCAVEIFELLPM